MLNYSELSWILLNKAELFCIVLNYDELCWIIAELFWITLNYSGLFWLILNNSELRWILVNYLVWCWTMLYIMLNHFELYAGSFWIICWMVCCITLNCLELLNKTELCWMTLKYSEWFWMILWNRLNWSDLVWISVNSSNCFVLCPDYFGIIPNYCPNGPVNYDLNKMLIFSLFFQVLN